MVIPGRCQRVRPTAGPMTGSASNYDVQSHIENLEIPGLVLTHHPGMTNNRHGRA